MSVWSHTKKWSTHVDTGSHFELRGKQKAGRSSKDRDGLTHVFPA